MRSLVNIVSAISLMSFMPSTFTRNIITGNMIYARFTFTVTNYYTDEYTCFVKFRLLQLVDLTLLDYYWKYACENYTVSEKHHRHF